MLSVEAGVIVVEDLKPGKAEELVATIPRLVTPKLLQIAAEDHVL